MTSPRSRILLALLVTSLTGALVAPAASQADAGSDTSATAAKKRKVAPRKGGKVRKAWPAKNSRGDRPNKKLAQFLAKQVGPTATKKRKQTRRLRVRASSTGPLLDFLPGSSTKGLRLVRSFDVPSNDPAAERMANLSWTYDSAVAAVALINAGEKAQAEQLLDQLAALQRTDGAIDYAFNVSDGSSIQLFNTGAIAWAGVAAALYRSTYRSDRYGTLAGGTTKWLLDRKLPSGLLSTRPGATSASTQHNIIAWYLLMLVTDRLPSGVSASTVTSVRDGLATAIKRDLLVTVDGSRMAFNQGAGDAMRPLDVQTLGVLFLAYDGALGHNPSAAAHMAKVYTYLYSAFPVSGRTITKSGDPKSFNQTYSSLGTFSGFRPYAVGGPDVLWAEGSAQVRFMQRVLGMSTSTLDSAINSWNLVSSRVGQGPLGADRSVTGNDVNEYHVWPTSAAASWTLMGSGGTPATPFSR
jgi:hypothetical protein